MRCFSIALVSAIILGELAVGGQIEKRARRKTRGRFMATEISCSFVENPNSICGQRGDVEYYYSGELAGDAIVPNLAECRQLCGNRMLANLETESDCESFSYNTTSGLCVLYRRRVEEQAFNADQSSTRVFYNKDCLACNPRCPDAVGADNHVDNGGFELSNSFIGPWEDKGFGGRLVPAGLNSTQAYYCPADNYFYCDIMQYRGLCLGQIYTLTARVRYEPPAAGNAHPQIGLATDELYTLITITDAFAPSVWATFSYTFRAIVGRTGNLPSLEFRTFDSSGSTVGQGGGSNRPGVYLDNVLVVPAPDDYTTSGSSLVPNGGFENGAIGPWIYSWRRPCFEVCDPSAREGTAEIVTPGLTPQSTSAFLYSNGYLGTVSLTSETFNLVRGAQYLFTFDYRITKHNTFAYIESYDEDNFGQWLANFQNLNPSGNVTRSFQRVVTAGATSCQIRFTFRATTFDDDNGVVNLDNIRLTRLA